jgi:integrase/recombinase XerD
VAIRKLQQVHALTHPGAKRRLRGVQTALDMPEGQADAPDAARALLEALAQEAEEDE